jgi:hypothetical protein
VLTYDQDSYQYKVSPESFYLNLEDEAFYAETRGIRRYNHKIEVTEVVNERKSFTEKRQWLVDLMDRLIVEGTQQAIEQKVERKPLPTMKIETTQNITIRQGEQHCRHSFMYSDYSNRRLCLFCGEIRHGRQ